MEHYTALVLLVISENIAVQRVHFSWGHRKEEGRRIRLVVRYQAQIFTNRHDWFREMSRPSIYRSFSWKLWHVCPQYPVMSMFRVNNEASHLFSSKLASEFI